MDYGHNIQLFINYTQQQTATTLELRLYVIEIFLDFAKAFVTYKTLSRSSSGVSAPFTDIHHIHLYEPSTL